MPGWDGEDQSVRQYRWLLRTSPLDALEVAHVEALAPMPRSRRSIVLRAVQYGLVTGLRLTPDDVGRIAHLVTVGERRRPGDFLGACPAPVLVTLAEGVILAEASFGRFGGYAAWDGSDPSPEEDGVDDSAYAEPWHVAVEQHVSYRGISGGRSLPGSAGSRGW
ncbi:hypothetical protein ACFUC1_10035 [Pedococcus sp. NPDC057267]|uniref:hypothetical protein n=1 Tax=Pedococcus sp. NPDC057267 TaxID=3346077 RepID=UPI003644200E